MVLKNTIFNLKQYYLIKDADAVVRLVKRLGPFKKVTIIGKEAIGYVGVQLPNNAWNRSYQHIVYVQNNSQKFTLAKYTIGREAVVLAKQVRDFLDLE